MRLTRTIKDQMAYNAATNPTIKARRQAHRLKQLDWAERVRLLINGPDEALVTKIYKDIDRLMLSLPEGFEFPGYGRHLANHTYVDIPHDGKTLVDWGVSRILKRASARYRLEDKALLEELDALEKEAKYISNDVADIRQKVLAVANSVTTVKKLLKVWPEAKELLPADLTRPAAKLPMVQLSELNKAIGIPTKPTPPGAE